MIAIALLVAAAVGSVARAEIGRRLNARDGFPFGTAVVNVSGAFLLGLLAATSAPAVTILGVGGLGGYTTFSSFARDAVALIEERRPAMAITYVVLTCVAGIAAAAAGIALVT